MPENGPVLGRRRRMILRNTWFSLRREDEDALGSFRTGVLSSHLETAVVPEDQRVPESGGGFDSSEPHQHSQDDLRRE